MDLCLILSHSLSPSFNEFVKGLSFFSNKTAVSVWFLLSALHVISSRIICTWKNNTQTVRNRWVLDPQPTRISPVTRRRTWGISRAFITAEKEYRSWACSFNAWANRITLCKTAALWLTVPVQPRTSTATPSAIRWCLQNNNNAELMEVQEWLIAKMT